MIALHRLLECHSDLDRPEILRLALRANYRFTGTRFRRRNRRNYSSVSGGDSRRESVPCSHPVPPRPVPEIVPKNIIICEPQAQARICLCHLARWQTSHHMTAWIDLDIRGVQRLVTNFKNVELSFKPFRIGPGVFNGTTISKSNTEAIAIVHRSTSRSNHRPSFFSEAAEAGIFCRNVADTRLSPARHRPA